MQTATFQVLSVLLLSLLMVSTRPSEEISAYDENEDQPHHVPRYHYSTTVHDEETMDIKSQSERRDGDKTEGEYSFLEADGTLRTVRYYVLGDSGFVATVHHTGQPTPATNDENIVLNSEDRKKKQMSHIVRVNLRNGDSLHRDHSMHWQHPITRKQPIQHMIQNAANLHNKVIVEPQRPKRFLIIVPDFTTPRSHEKSHIEKNDSSKALNSIEKHAPSQILNGRLPNKTISDNQSQNQFINSPWRPVDRNVNNTSKNSNYNLRGHQQQRPSNQRYILRSPLKKQEIPLSKQYLDLASSKGNTEYNKINGDRGKSDMMRLPFFPKNDNTKESTRQTSSGHFQKLNQQQSTQRKHQFSPIQNRQPEMSDTNKKEHKNNQRPVSQYSVYEHIDENETLDQTPEDKTPEQKQNLTSYVANYQNFPPAEDQQMAEKNIVQHHVLKDNITSSLTTDHKIENMENLERHKNQNDTKHEVMQNPNSKQSQTDVISAEINQKEKLENDTVSEVSEVKLAPPSTVLSQKLPPLSLQPPSYSSYNFNSKQIPRKNKNELQLSPYLQPPPIQS